MDKYLACRPAIPPGSEQGLDKVCLSPDGRSFRDTIPFEALKYSDKRLAPAPAGLFLCYIRLVLEDIFLWVGLVGLMSGLAVGISLLESEGDSFLRNVMFSGGIACAMFAYLLTMGEETPWSPILFAVSLVIGGVAALLVAFAAHGNLRAAFVAGGLAAVVLQLMLKLLPPGSFGYTPIHDIPTAIDIMVTILVIVGVYYLLRNWGKDGEEWD